jgi:tetratricopeptide (TPR) repeat protein
VLLIFSISSLANGAGPAASTPLALIESGHLKRARAMVEERYRANPKDPESLYLMSLVKQEFHDLETAFDFAKKAVAADPRNSRYHSQVAYTAGGLAQQAHFLRMISLATRAKKEADAAIALDPNNVGALKILGLYYLHAPFFIGGNKAKARAIPDQIMQIDPVEGCFAHIYLANYEKQYDRVEKLYLKALEARPENFILHQALADYYLGNRRFEEGEKHAREAIRIDAGRASAHCTLAALLVQQRKMAELDSALEEAEKAVPDNLAPYYAAVAWCPPQGMPIQRGEAYLRKYLAQEPEPNMPTHAATHNLLGLHLYAVGHKEEGVSELQLAVKLDPNSLAKNDLKKLK